MDPGGSCELQSISSCLPGALPVKANFPVVPVPSPASAGCPRHSDNVKLRRNAQSVSSEYTSVYLQDIALFIMHNYA